MKIKFLLIFFYVLASFHIFSQSQSHTFYTTGFLFIGGEGDNDITLYIQGDIELEGSTVQIQQEGVTQITGDFHNNVSLGNIFDTNFMGTVEFIGTDTQYITGTADKTLNYINFPNITINNSSTVQLDSEMGMEVTNLNLIKGRLVLQSKPNETISTQTDIAHLLVRNGGYVNYTRDTANINDNGIIEVQLALGDNYQSRKLVGFSSPFNRIYSDYFTFNFLTKPSPNGLFGDQGMLITDIHVPMNAGEGYIVGQGIVQDEAYYQQYLNEEWSGARYEDRYTTMFSFARDFMPQSFAQYNTASDRFTGEAINITDVTVPLSGNGFHYVGNPFTTPIDLSGFVQETTVADQWGVTRSADATGELRNAFYVMSGGTGTYDADAPASSQFTFNVSYLLGQAVGGTISYAGGYLPSLMIAPMQMFLVGKNTLADVNFVIPASARTHGPANFLRSTPVCTDEILIEVTDQDTESYDRLCVVFREGASLHSNDKYDAVKIFNYSKGVSQIYTKSSDNKKMTTNVISSETEFLDLYLQPTLKSKNVKLTAHRLYSLYSVNTLILEDKFTGIFTDLLTYPSYEFTINPDDNEDRFVLHFTKQTTREKGLDILPIGIYAKNKQISLYRLNEQDNGSTVTVYDIHGRMIYQDKINTLSEYTTNRYFEIGMYIVKVTGARNIVNKVMIK